MGELEFPSLPQFPLPPPAKLKISIVSRVDITFDATKLKGQNSRIISTGWSLQVADTSGKAITTYRVYRLYDYATMFVCTTLPLYCYMYSSTQNCSMEAIHIKGKTVTLNAILHYM